MDSYNYKTRDSYSYNKNHIHDIYKNLGYNYKGNLYKNTISPEILGNPKISAILLKMENFILFLIEYTKSIKKQYSIAHDKNTTNIN